MGGGQWQGQGRAGGRKCGLSRPLADGTVCFRMLGLYSKLCTTLHKKWSLVHTLRACILIARSILRNSAANSVARTTFSYGQTSCWYTDRPNIQGSYPSVGKKRPSFVLPDHLLYLFKRSKRTYVRQKGGAPPTFKKRNWSSPRLQKEMVSPPPHAPKQESPAPSYSL